MDSTTLVFGLLFGSIGIGYFIYGKKQRRGMAYLSGVALMISPYLVSNIVLLIILGIVFMALPFFIEY